MLATSSWRITTQTGPQHKSSCGTEIVLVYLLKQTKEKMNAKDKKSNIDCPRCEGFIPNNKTPGYYCGALSRADNKTEICSECGTEEAMEDWNYKFVTPVNNWPVVSERKNERTEFEFKMMVAVEFPQYQSFQRSDDSL